MKPELIIGVAGGSGSGKSTIVERLMTGRFGPEIAILPHDAYYFDAEQLPLTAHGMRNWDHPEALENALYLQHIEQLAGGQAIERPEYDFEHHVRAATQVAVATQTHPVAGRDSAVGRSCHSGNDRRGVCTSTHLLICA